MRLFPFLLLLSFNAGAVQFVNSPYSFAEPGVTLPQIDFDGTNDYVTLGADLDGVSDDDRGIISFWINTDVDDTDMWILGNSAAGADPGFFVLKTAANTIRFSLRTPAGTKINNTLDESVGMTEILAASGWQHVAISWATAGAGVIGEITIDGDTETRITGTSLADADFTTGNFSVGAQTDGGSKLNGCLAQVYVNLGDYVNLFDPSDAEKFYDVGNTGSDPVFAADLGADGSEPTESQPDVLLNNSLATWQTNLGSGGGMTENGTLGSCP